MALNGRKGSETALIVALAQGAPVKEAAEQAGVSERTAYRRLNDPAFQQEVRAARDAVLSDASARLSSLATQAAETLRGLLHSPSDSIRLSTARAILELTPKLRQTVEFESRLAKVERRSAGTEPEDPTPRFHAMGFRG